MEVKFDESCRNRRQAGPILLFAEKCPETFEADERNPTGILTWASDLFPPSRLAAVALGIVAVTVAQPSRNLTGFPDIRLRWAESLPPVSKNNLILQRPIVSPSLFFAVAKT